MNTQDYPEHTAPEPPAGMKWEYRGLGWRSSGVKSIYSFFMDTPHVVHATETARGFGDYHYFEAVPKTSYPEHAAPEPPAGMKWDYRGLGWTSDRRATYYYIGDPNKSVNTNAGTPSDIKSNIPYGVGYLHYFEAVPLTVEPKVLLDKLTPVTPEEASLHSAKFHEAMRRATMKDVHGLDPKGDAGSLKAPLYLLPSHPLHEASWVLKAGAKKYGKFNWRQSKVCASTYRSAMQRHLDQWFDGGEDMDSETQRSHLAHVIANACILMDAMKHGTLADDRP